MDGFMAGHLAQLHAPGAAVVVVKDGQILLAKGYGYADLEQRRPFTAATAFRVKSVSKTFTAAAVMQLSEERRVDLRAPVRSYLNGFRLPDGNAPAINLDQLLTQTSGIGDRAVGTLTPDRIAAADLRTYLAANMPPRIASPGTVFSYTDHGISLAGLVVEQVCAIGSSGRWAWTTAHSIQRSMGRSIALSATSGSAGHIGELLLATFTSVQPSRW